MDPTGAGSYPEQAVNLSAEDLGSAFYILSPDDGLYHQFTLTATDPSGFGYVWTDYAQVASPPASIYRTIPHARLDAGLYLSDSGEGSVGAQIHKFGSVSGIWSDVAQGQTVPL